MPAPRLTSLRRTACLVAACAAGLIAAAPAAASSWPEAGGGPGNAGLQVTDPGSAPFASAYAKTAGSDQWIMNSPVVTSGGPASRRLAYGTLNGFVHLQSLLTGAPVGSESGVNVDSGPINDLDVFTGLGNNAISRVSFVSMDHAGGTRLLVLHNDENQDGGVNDLALAQIDAATGALVSDDPIPGSDGFTVSSSPVLSDPDVNGNRHLLFVASNSQGNGWVGKLEITNATGANPTMGAGTGFSLSSASLFASPAIAYLNDANGVPTQYVVVPTHANGSEATVKTFKVSDLTAGPQTANLNAQAQTPAVPVTAGGLNPGAPGSGVSTAPAIYVTVGSGSAARPYRLTQSGSSQSLTATPGPQLAGFPSQAMAVTQTASSGGLSAGRLVVSTESNLYVLDGPTLALSATHSPSPLTAGTTGFYRTAPAVAGSHIFISRDSGRSLVLNLADAQALSPSQFPEHAGNATALLGTGQPAVAGWFAAYVSNRGAFVYRTDDPTPPAATPSLPAAGALVQGTQELRATAYDSRGIASVVLRVDGTPVATVTSPATGDPFTLPGGEYATNVDTTTLAEGSHSFDVVATDTSGVATTSSAHSFIVDNTVPDTTIGTAPGAVTDETEPSFGFTSSEAGFVFECRVDGGAWDACASPYSAGPLADGEHLFEVRAVDTAGNFDSTAAGHSFRVDTVAPETAIDNGPPPAGGGASPTFAFSANESGSSFECRMDGGSWEPCTSPHSSAALADGDHGFDVRASDAAGNVDTSQASRAFSVDATAPDTTIDLAPEPVSPELAPSFEFSASEPGATFECRIDEGTWETCASPFSFGELGEGDHVFEVRATDAVGNFDSSAAAHAFRIEPAIVAPTPIKLLDRELTLWKSGRVLIPARCPAAEEPAGCEGVMSFFVTYHPAHRHDHAGHDHTHRADARVLHRHQRRTRRVRKRRFELLPGERKTLPVQLGDFTRRLACARGNLDVKVVQSREVDGVWVNTKTKLNVTPSECPAQ